ncbi:hypothetical protein [uncultured Selenomonas sp.]|uniref:hypothetical protein n=1 Tax=uncultured Selenomonas sp. TaxID=159275 RepID=UPI0026010DDA|nr:hypothetical protein [uncultured Selenomonas sp.]
MARRVVVLAHDAASFVTVIEIGSCGSSAKISARTAAATASAASFVRPVAE